MNHRKGLLAACLLLALVTLFAAPVGAATATISGDETSCGAAGGSWGFGYCTLTDYTVAAGDTLNIVWGSVHTGGAFAVASGGTLNISAGTLQNDGGPATNAGTITMKGGVFIVRNELTNTGTIYLCGGSIDGSITGNQPVAGCPAPTASPTQSPPANSAGWNNADVTVTWHWADYPGGSGIDPANCTTSSTSSGEGDAITLSATCTDLAGNTGSAADTVKVDKTAPTGITGTPARQPNAAGWYNAAVTVTFSGTDATAHIASCTSPSYSGPDGANKSVSGSCTDNAGNVGTGSSTLNYDATPPSNIVGTPDRAPDSNGWYNHAVTVIFTGQDAASGLPATGACTQGAAYSGPDSASASVAGSCTDSAGNGGTGSFPLKYDATRPTTSASPSGTAGSNGWYTGAVQVALTATDNTGGSGVASTSYTLDGGAAQTYTAPVAVAGAGAHNLTFSSTDAAGNVETTQSATIRIANPAPTIAGLSPAAVTTAAPFTLAVTGTGFVAGATTIQVGSASYPAAQVTVTDSAHLSVSVPASAVAALGTVAVTVTNPAPGGGSAAATLAVINRAPTLAPPANLTLHENAGPQTVALTGIGPGDNDTGQTLTVTATSDTPGVIPNPSVAYTSPNATGALTFTALANASTATTPVTITVTVRDSGGTASGGQDTTVVTFTVTVTRLVGIAVAPATGTMKVGQMQQFVATGHYADHSTADLTSAVTWSSDAAAIASVDTSGKGTGQSSGSAHLTATQGSVSGQASVTVSAPTPVGIAPAAAPANRPAGTTSEPSARPAPSGAGRGGTTGGTAPVALPTGR